MLRVNTNYEGHISKPIGIFDFLVAELAIKLLFHSILFKSIHYNALNIDDVMKVMQKFW